MRRATLAAIFVRAGGGARPRGDAGFTLTELMAALVIVGVLSALTLPSLGRDQRSKLGAQYANQVLREFQRARMDAVAERLPQRAYVFRDRIEIRSAVPATRPGGAPRAPTLTDAPVRTVLAGTGVTLFDCLPTPTVPGTPNLTGTAYREIEFNSRGQAQLIGHPAMTPAYLYISNDGVEATHPDRRFRVDLAPLTARANLRTGWN